MQGVGRVVLELAQLLGGDAVAELARHQGGLQPSPVQPVQDGVVGGVQIRGQVFLDIPVGQLMVLLGKPPGQAQGHKSHHNGRHDHRPVVPKLFLEGKQQGSLLVRLAFFHLRGDRRIVAVLRPQPPRQHGPAPFFLLVLRGGGVAPRPQLFRQALPACGLGFFFPREQEHQGEGDEHQQQGHAQGGDQNEVQPLLLA